MTSVDSHTNHHVREKDSVENSNTGKEKEEMMLRSVSRISSLKQSSRMLSLSAAESELVSTSAQEVSHFNFFSKT